MWRTAKLGDICTIVNGGTPKSNVKDYWDGNIKWLTPKDMGKLQDKYVRNTERQITADGLANSSAKLVPKNSIILSCRAPIGHVFINDCEMSFNQGCKGLIPGKDLLVEYLYYFLFASKKLLNDLGTGTTFKEISGKTLSNVTISLPPLAEQQRIVAKLDAAFAEIDRAIEIAKEKIDAINTVYDAQVNVLLSTLMHNQKTIKLKEMCERITVGYVGKMSNQYVDAGIPFLRSQSIRPYRVSSEGLLYISNEFNIKISKSQLKTNDVCVVRTGYPGTAAVITEEWDGANCSDLVIFTPSSKLNPHFLELFFNSNFGKKLVLGKVVGAAQKHFNVTTAKEINFPNVHVHEQKKTVSMARKLRYNNELAISSANKKIEKLALLKSAILAQELQPSEAA